MAKRVDDDKDLDLLSDELAAIIAKPTGKLKPLATQQKQTQEEETDMNKEQFTKAKLAHKEAIAELKAEMNSKKRDIKRHKLLIKQAKIIYKLGKMKEETQS